MPRIKSSIKDVRRTKHRRTTNREAMSKLRTVIRTARESKAANRQSVLQEAYSVIDKAAQSGLIHRNTAARYKSSITRVKAATQPAH
jgi:small subunit ribosomal protein S20